MTTVFPGAVDSFSTKVDNVTDVLAAHINDVQDSIVAIETVVIAQAPNPNLLYHTLSHDIWPDGVTFNDVTDDTYVAALWNAIHNGQNPDVSGVAAVIDGSKRALKCLFDSASSQAGFVQFLSSEDTFPLRGKTLTFSIVAETSNIVNMRCAIIEWVGTADSITSDVVATWQAGNPVLATNWAYVGDASVDQAISGETILTAEGRTISATANNIGVFVWNPAVEASTDYFQLGKAKLEISLTATAFVAPTDVEERVRVGHFFRRYYSTGTNESSGAIGMVNATNFIGGRPISPPMRISPTLQTSGTLSDYAVFDVTDHTPTDLNQWTSRADFLGLAWAASGLTSGNAGLILFKTANAYLGMNARL